MSSSATTTVLVHGAWSTGAVWREVADLLAGEVHTPTSRGCGPAAATG